MGSNVQTLRVPGKWLSVLRRWGVPRILCGKFREPRVRPIHLWNSADNAPNSGEPGEQGFSVGVPEQGW